MNRWVFIPILVCVFLIGCVQGSKVICNEPYIQVGDSCCLDKDQNSVCDKDEIEDADCPTQAFDCDSCPPKIVTEREEVEVLKYVCQDGETTVSNPDDCVEAQKEPDPVFDPVTTNEDDQPVILDFSVRPACRGSDQAVEIYFDVGTAANDVEFQIKTDPEGEWETVYEFSSPVYKKYLYAVFCMDDTCTQNADFFLRPDKIFLLRAKFDMTDTSWGKIFYTNEHVIDDTDDGEYGTKLC